MSDRVQIAAAAALLIAWGVISSTSTSTAWAEEIPDHPRGLRYPELAYEPPKAAEHRAVLSNGLRVYLVPDRSLPAIRVEAWIEGAEVRVPKDRRGLAKITGALMRAGGVEGLDARALDARLDALAAEIEVEIGLETGHASLWTLAKHQKEALALFAAVLERPAFAEDRIRRAKDELTVEIAHRDDDPEAVLERRVAEIVYGDHPLAWRETAETVAAISREEIVDFHRRTVVPAATILAVSGDFEREAMVERLEALFGGWKPQAAKGFAPTRCEATGIPPLPPEPRPGVFVLDRPLNQGYVEMAERGIAIGDPDEVPFAVMNFILGGGSFTSRITARIRNDEGLAYSAGSYFEPGRGHPGIFAVYYQSKAPSAAFAAKISLEELRRIRSEPVSATELERAKSSLRDRFPERFATAAATAAALARNEFDGRPLDYLDRYGARIAAVTAEDVLRVAKARLAPERLSTVVVGPAETILARDEAHGAAFADIGKVEMLAPE